MVQSIWLRVALLVVMAIMLSGCAAVAGIFKAGFWVGTIAVLVVIGGIVAVASMMKS